MQLLDKDVIRQLQQVCVFTLHFAQDAHSESRPRERVSIDHLAGQAQFEADFAHLVLEQFAQWLDELHTHFLGQATHVVMRLDDVRLTRLSASGFDHVGVNRALREPVNAFEFVRFLIEDIDEQAADDLALIFGVTNTLERIEEAIRGIHANHIDMHMLGKGLHDLVALVMAHQTMVNEYTNELIPDRLVQQRRNDR